MCSVDLESTVDTFNEVQQVLSLRQPREAGPEVQAAPEQWSEFGLGLLTNHIVDWLYCSHGGGIHCGCLCCHLGG